MVMAEPAPKVEAARASAAIPRAAPDDVDPAISSKKVSAEVAPAVESACAEPPESGSFTESAPKTSTPQEEEQNEGNIRLGVEALRQTKRIAFESPAAVVVGPHEKGLCQRMIPCVFDERSFLSYGECKRYILVVLDGPSRYIFVYSDVRDVSPPLYTIPLMDLVPMKEDSEHPDFYSHTISPEANTGLPLLANKSKGSLETVLLKGGNDGKIAFQFAFDRNEAGDDAVEKFVDAATSSKSKLAKR